MAVAEPGPMSADAFLAWLAGRSERWELVDGVPVRMMAGAKQSHDVAASNILVALAPGAKRRGCRATASDTAVRTGPVNVRFPDVVVDCGPPDPGAREAAGPTLVVEVASPGTLVVDLTDKLDEYRRVEAIRLILLVEPDVIAAKLWRRDETGGWGAEKYDDLDARIPLPEIGAELALADVYDTLEPTRRLRVVGEV
ncbi:Uma2 family endonuclease [Salinarimonas rosea]|uniref:Uma2 family endonuclease n=1 Tax=Salinarimonas rosea TaxID=552063 RepID=UPI00041C730F|nr:Uma2 family endonuclease [Salinarimonas rosea]